MDDCCLFISSSDNTYDVFDLISPSVIKNWPTENFDVYVGLNNKVSKEPFHTIGAPVSEWSTELSHQINALPERFRYVILILDDFFFYEKVDPNQLTLLVSLVREQRIDYLRLKPLERSALGKVLLFQDNFNRNHNGIIRLADDEPYYSSLQVAIWNREHLLNMLKQRGSIWEFELNAIAGSAHYATLRELVRYKHLVEKGKWFKYAPATLGFHDKTLFEQRGFYQSMLKNFRIYNQIKFFLFGYSFFRLRQAIKQIRSNFS